MKQIIAETSLINEFPILAKMPNALLDRLNATAFWRRYELGEQVQNRKESCDGLMKVKSGSLRVFMQSESGKEITLYRLYKNDTCVMSASCLLNNMDVDFLIEAETETIVILLPTTYLRNASDSYPILKDYLNELVQHRFSQLTWVLQQVVFSSMPTRLATYLVEMYVNSESKSLELTHELIASDLGSAREVISRLLKYFQEEKLVSLSRSHIELIDIDRLKQIK